MDELIPAFRQSIFNDSLADGVANIAEVGIDSIMSDGLLKDIPIVNLLLNASRTFKAIHERNLLKNTALFLDAVNSQKIDDKKVQAYKKKLLNEKTAERELGRVIVLLDQYVDNIKAQMLGRLFCQYIDRDYSWDKFCELSDILNRLFLDDMPFLYSIFGSDGRQAIYHIYKIPYNIKRLESITKRISKDASSLLTAAMLIPPIQDEPNQQAKKQNIDCCIYSSNHACP